MKYCSPLKVTVNDENEQTEGNVSNFHGMGGLKGGDGLFLGVKRLFFTTLGKTPSTLMSYPIIT